MKKRELSEYDQPITTLSFGEAVFLSIPGGLAVLASFFAAGLLFEKCCKASRASDCWQSALLGITLTALGCLGVRRLVRRLRNSWNGRPAEEADDVENARR